MFLIAHEFDEKKFKYSFENCPNIIIIIKEFSVLFIELFKDSLKRYKDFFKKIIDLIKRKTFKNKTFKWISLKNFRKLRITQT